MAMYNCDERVLKIASRFHFKYNPGLPIPIVDLVKEHAELTEVDLPFSFDGLCVDLKIPGKRPKVIIKRSANRRRKRFTLAHELGHIFIPWHAGNIIDNIGDPDGDVDFYYWTMEKEANSFASELLMPRPFVKDIVSQSGAIEEVIANVREECDVSTVSAVYRCIQFMPKNHVICFSYDGAEHICVRSPETKVFSPYGDSLAHIGESELPNGERTEFYIGSYNFVHWYFPERLPFPTVSDGAWKPVLDECLKSYFDDSSEIAKIKQRMNGIISSVNSSMRESRDEEELYAAFVHRISRDNEFSYLLDDPLFHEFAALRILDFLSRR